MSSYSGTRIPVERVDDSTLKPTSTMRHQESPVGNSFGENVPGRQNDDSSMRHQDAPIVNSFGENLPSKQFGDSNWKPTSTMRHQESPVGSSFGENVPGRQNDDSSLRHRESPFASSFGENMPGRQNDDSSLRHRESPFASSFGEKNQSGSDWQEKWNTTNSSTSKGDTIPTRTPYGELSTDTPTKHSDFMQSTNKDRNMQLGQKQDDSLPEHSAGKQNLQSTPLQVFTKDTRKPIHVLKKCVRPEGMEPITAEDAKSYRENLNPVYSNERKENILNAKIQVTAMLNERLNRAMSHF